MVDEFLEGARENLEAADNQRVARTQFREKRVEAGGMRGQGDRILQYPSTAFGLESMALQPQGFAIRGSARIAE